MKSFSVQLRFGMLAVSVLALVAGCGGDDGSDGSPDPDVLVECPPDSDAQQSRGASVIANQCVTCHSTAGGSQGGLDFNNATTVKANAEKMMSEVESGAMPPGATVEKSSVDDLRVYLSCL
ncbi:c-type cytochrome [Chondromyces crocatus]|uniref:Cytochrome c domain-containing protein n=1 Tax=Chondromyces crocatus TaxID=52 RepID=A0A0K1E6A1_CHOCO|nr:hypothetical protein [Chondromyces crocatus]AKT36384.1 uncharacterized protein CMC5_004970 [Chondromyces crocatus]